MNRDEARKELKALLKRGDTVYCQLVSVSRSGMLRRIALFVIKKNKPINITWLVGHLGLFSFDKDNHALKVHGCGMDMGFHAVYELSGTLFGRRKGNPDDPGYALNREWL